MPTHTQGPAPPLTGLTPHLPAKTKRGSQGLQADLFHRSPEDQLQRRGVPCTQPPAPYGPSRFKDLGKSERNLTNTESTRELQYESCSTVQQSPHLQKFHFPFSFLSVLQGQMDREKALCHRRSLPLPPKGNLVNETPLFLLVGTLQRPTHLPGDHT